MKSLLLLIVFALGFIQFGCSKKTDDEYMQLASNSVKQNNISQAVQAYQDLIKTYPNSPKVPDAIFQLATLYQNKMVKGIQSRESLQKAVDLFKSLYDKYPQNQYAPKALFMSGFILANDLQDYSQATLTFKIFLNKYPNNELAQSDKEELDNMGLSPAEVLQKKKDKKL
jgi:TolA-binding protein